MPYRMVTNVGKICGQMAGAAVKHADRIVDSFSARWSDQLEDGEELTVRKLLALLSQDLRQAHSKAVETENQLRSEIRQDKQGRGTRNRAMSALRELMFDVKKLCDAHYGPGSVETLFEEDSEDIPIEANEVLRLGLRVRRNMLDPEFPMPSLKHGIAPDFAALASRFDQPLADLEASLRELQQGTQGSSAAIADKERDLGQMQEMGGDAGRFLESITSLAGHKGVARRIRQSRHRTRASTSESEEPDFPEAEELPPETETAEDNPSEVTPEFDGGENT